MNKLNTFSLEILLIDNAASKQENDRIAREKLHELGRLLVGKMAVNLANQHPAVLVPDPCRDRHKVHPGHNGRTDEIMPEVMESEAWQAGGSPGKVQRLPEGARR